MLHIVTDEGAGHPKLHIGFEPVVVRGVDLRDQRLEAFFQDQEVQVCRAVIMAMSDAKQISDRAVDRDRVSRRLYAVESEMAFCIGNLPRKFISACLGSCCS